MSPVYPIVLMRSSLARSSPRGVAIRSRGHVLSNLDLGLAGAWEFWSRLTTPDGWLVEGTTIRRLGPN